MLTWQLVPGVATAALGEIVCKVCLVRALSNVLESPIVLFTSATGLPIIITRPSHTYVSNIHPIYLTLNMFGAGHYDLAVINDSHPEQVHYNKFCLCASRKQIKGKPCMQSQQYSTRCPCFNTQRPCSKECQCENEYGIRPV